MNFHNLRIKVAHVHIDLSKMFITLVWNTKNLFTYTIFISYSFFVYVKFQSLLLIYNINLMTL